MHQSYQGRFFLLWPNVSQFDHKHMFLFVRLTVVTTDFIIRNEQACVSSEWIIDYWTISVGAQASH